MPETRSRNDRQEAAKRRLKTLLDEVKSKPTLYEAISGVVTAMDYEDVSLIESATQSTLACLAELISGLIPREVEKAERTRIAIRESWAEIVIGVASTDFDDLKNLIESILDQRISTVMAKIEVVRKLQEIGHPVQNAPQLESSVRDLRRFRESLLKSWPSASDPFLPLDRDAIGTARTAIKKGDHGLTKEQMAWRPSVTNQ